MIGNTIGSILLTRLIFQDWILEQSGKDGDPVNILRDYEGKVVRIYDFLITFMNSSRS